MASEVLSGQYEYAGCVLQSMTHMDSICRIVTATFVLKLRFTGQLCRIITCISASRLAISIVEPFAWIRCPQHNSASVVCKNDTPVAEFLRLHQLDRSVYSIGGANTSGPSHVVVDAVPVFAV